MLLFLTFLCVFFLCNLHLTLTNCPFGCKKYSNGCNTCDCNLDGTVTIGHCTDFFCPFNFTAQPKCLECFGNLKWNNCSHSCPTMCGVSSNLCNITNGCNGVCECPTTLPTYYNGTCYAQGYCNVKNNICPSHCLSYFDGCNNCDCLANGKGICTTRPCPLTQASGKCLKCESNMVWNPCGSCLKTCETMNDACSDHCVAECTCPTNKPIWKNNVCVPTSACKCECDAKTAGSNKKCSKLKVRHLCNAINDCEWKCD